MKAPLRSLLTVFLILAGSGFAKVIPLRLQADSLSLAQKENWVWRSAMHGSEFAAVPNAVSRMNCEATRPPEALTTPDPLLDREANAAKVRVSFIIGTDGRVHSPLVLESAGADEDRNVLEVVRSWRYRPAMCNGVPTESEAKVEFSGR